VGALVGLGVLAGTGLPPLLVGKGAKVGGASPPRKALTVGVGASVGGAGTRVRIASAVAMLLGDRIDTGLDPLSGEALGGAGAGAPPPVQAVARTSTAMRPT